MQTETSSSAGRLEELMRRCGTSLPPAEFIRTVSNLYHAFESPIYEELHPEIPGQVPPLVPELVAGLPDRISALEIGCGTGATSRVLIEVLGARLERYTCSDASPKMVERCRLQLAGSANAAFLVADAEQLAQEGTTYDLVVTCSVVHHIADLRPFFGAVGRLVRPGGHYLMLHEPSSRYPHNPECAAAWRDFRREQQRRRWLRFLDPRNYLRRLRWVLRGQGGDIRERVAARLLETGAVRTAISPEEVARLVDIHDSILNQDGLGFGECGFWPDELGSRYLPGFRLLHTLTYGFLGDVAESSVPPRWRQVATELRRQFPQDGANFCALWQKDG